MHYYSNSWGSHYMSSSSSTATAGVDPVERIRRVAAESAVVVFSASTCCMSHAVKRLLCSMGVHPTIYELDRVPHGKDMERALGRIVGGGLPVVFIGGRLVGGMDRVMGAHINGTLIPLLKEAGALWL